MEVFATRVVRMANRVHMAPHESQTISRPTTQKGVEEISKEVSNHIIPQVIPADIPRQEWNSDGK